MVKFIVKVRLMEKSVKSHVGSVIVEKVMSQYKPRGTTWKAKVNTQPIHPAIVEGVGGGKGGWEESTAERALAGTFEESEVPRMEDEEEDEGAEVTLRASDGAKALGIVERGEDARGEKKIPPKAPLCPNV